MAALAAAFTGWRLCEGTGEYALAAPAAAGGLNFYKGGIASMTPGTGTLIVTSVDTSEAFGIVEQQTLAAATSAPIKCWVRGLIWLTGVANFTTVNNTKMFGATVGSDNPADLIVQAALNPGALGKLLLADVTAVSGYLDISDRSAVTNA